GRAAADNHYLGLAGHGSDVARAAQSAMRGELYKSSVGLNLQSILDRERLELLADRDGAGRAVEQRMENGGGLAEVELEQHGLDRSDRGRRQRERAEADRGERQRPDRLRGEFATQGHRLAVLLGLGGDVPQRPQQRGRERVESLGNALVAAVGGV